MFVNNSIVQPVTITKYLEGEAPQHLALTELKARLWEEEDPQNLAPDQNHLLGVSDGLSQNRLKARASLEGKHIVMMRIMYTGQPSNDLTDVRWRAC